MLERGIIVALRDKANTILDKLREVEAAAANLEGSDPGLAKKIKETAIKSISESVGALLGAGAILAEAPSLPDIPMSTQFDVEKELTRTRYGHADQQSLDRCALMEQTAMAYLALSLNGTYCADYGRLEATAKVLEMNGLPTLAEALAKRPDLEAHIEALKTAVRLE